MVSYFTIALLLLSFKFQDVKPTENERIIFKTTTEDYSPIIIMESRYGSLILTNTSKEFNEFTQYVSGREGYVQFNKNIFDLTDDAKIVLHENCSFKFTKQTRIKMARNSSIECHGRFLLHTTLTMESGSRFIAQGEIFTSAEFWPTLEKSFVTNVVIKQGGQIVSNHLIKFVRTNLYIGQNSVLVENVSDILYFDYDSSFRLEDNVNVRMNAVKLVLFNTNATFGENSVLIYGENDPLERMKWWASTFTMAANSRVTVQDQGGIDLKDASLSISSGLNVTIVIPLKLNEVGCILKKSASVIVPDTITSAKEISDYMKCNKRV